jgi:hypothetical protein
MSNTITLDLIVLIKPNTKYRNAYKNNIFNYILYYIINIYILIFHYIKNYNNLLYLINK